MSGSLSRNGILIQNSQDTPALKKELTVRPITNEAIGIPAPSFKVFRVGPGTETEVSLSPGTGLVSASVPPPKIPESLLLVVGALILLENCERDNPKLSLPESKPLRNTEGVSCPSPRGKEKHAWPWLFRHI